MTAGYQATDLDHIDAAIHIFDPSIELEQIEARLV
jgi:hypothetical protein